MKYGKLIGALMLASLGLSACSAASSSSSSAIVDTNAPGADALNGKGEVDITFWHEMGGANGNELTALVNQFNAAHVGKVKVNLVFKNDYDSALNAYKTVSGGDGPDLVQMYDLGTRYMIDSKTTVPMQSFIDKDKWDATDLQPAIAGYYTVGGKLYSMPFNTSMPLLYINKEAFVKAGLDPANPPKTLDGITAAAEKIKAASGESVQYGFGASLYGWFFEQLVAHSGASLCTPSNGRSGTATSVDLATDANVKLVQWWQNMVNNGLAMKLDSDTKKGDTAFSSGAVAMTLESTGSLKTFNTGAAGKFTVGTGDFPALTSSDSGGPIIGGASLWIVGAGKSDAQKRASWELTKFLADPQSQVAWHTNTGYFPISKSALTDPVDKAWVAARPQFETAITQLANTPVTTSTQGCSSGVMPQIRKDIESALQAAVLTGTDAKSALTQAEQKANAQLADYNKKVK